MTTVVRICMVLTILGLLDAKALAEEHDYLTTVGVKGVELGHRHSGHNTLGRGVGAFVERSFWHHQMELELSVVAADFDNNLVLPIEVLLKHDHQLGAHVSVFAGAGASVLFAEEAGHHTSSGFAASVGAHYWATPHWGIDMEVDYSLLAFGGASQEVSMAAGPVVRF